MKPRLLPRLRTLAAAAALFVAAAPAFALSIIIDNDQSPSSPHKFTTNGTWATSTATSGYYGSNYAHATGPSASTAARFRPDIATAGTYRIYLKWTAHTNRADRVPVEVTYPVATTSGTQMKTETVRRLNQQVNGGVWVFLGTYYLGAGTGNSVLIRASDTGNVAADAVLFDLVDPASTPPPGDLMATARAEYTNSDARLNPVETLVVRTDSAASGVAPAFQLRRNGATYDVKGACGVETITSTGSLLASAGANSVRSYSGASTTITDALLKNISDAGMTITIGLAMSDPGATGTFYNDPVKVQAQYDNLVAQIDSWKNYQAVLAWGIGNEIDVSTHPDPVPIYAAIEQLARYVRDHDHYHPVTTVHAGSDPLKITRVRIFSPSVDLVSFNSYAHADDVYTNVINADWTGPYMITEYNIDQPMDVFNSGPKTSWGAVIEPLSNAKMTRLLDINNDDLLVHPRCVGGYVFKGAYSPFRVTLTWYNILHADATAGLIGTPSFDAMRIAWGGPASSATTAPKVLTITLDSQAPTSSVVLSGSSGNAISLVTVDAPSGSTLQYAVEIRPEVALSVNTAPAPVTGVTITQDSGDPRKFYIKKSDLPAGDYRLFYYVSRLNGSGTPVSVGTANIPFRRS